MQSYSHLFDLPCQTNFSHRNITNHCQNQQASPYDLPRQIIDHPYQHNQPKYHKNNQTISKCAVTEMSSKDEQEYTDEITPICQLFGLQEDNFFQQFQLPTTLQSEEIITEATFKPNELHQYLHNQTKENNKIKSLLQQNVFNHTKKVQNRSKGKQNYLRKDNACQKQEHTSDKVQVKTKTKYQRILQQFFNLPIKRAHIKHKLSLQKIPAYKIPTEVQSHHQKPLYQHIISQEPKVRSRTFQHSQSQKQLTLNQRLNNEKQQPTLKKTFSQQKFKCANNYKQQPIERWLKMTFEERQLKTIENRMQKERKGRLFNMQRQTQDCTFKPQIRELKGKPKDTSSGSYAKIYYQKIRKRL